MLVVVVEVEVEVQGTRPGVRDGHVPALGLGAAEMPTGPLAGVIRNGIYLYCVLCI